MRTRHTFVATLLVALLAIAGVTAAIAADPAEPPPPRIAFVANGRVPADALAAGPTAGQLGAPIFTTEQAVLPDSTGDALDAYNPELVIVLGGPVAIADAVVTQISAATGLAVVDPTPPPTTGVVRAAGEDRFITATVVADLLSAYDPAYLGVDLQAVDADLLDGKDSSAFVEDTDAVGGDLTGTYAAPELSAGSVGTAEVADGSLTLDDISVFNDQISFDPPNIGGNSCVLGSIPVPEVQFNDVTIVRPSANINPITVTTVSPISNGSIRFLMCNPTNAAQNRPSGGWWFTALRP